jgi:hypothetical protein
MRLNGSASSISHRQATVMFPPCSAKATALANPIPKVPPVINTAFPANDEFIGSSDNPAFAGYVFFSPITATVVRTVADRDNERQ